MDLYKEKIKSFYGVITYTVVMYLLSSIIALIVSRYYINLLPFKSLNERYQAITNFVCYIILFIPLIYIFFETLLRDFKYFFSKKNIIKYLASVFIGYLILLGFSYISSIILNLLNAGKAENQETIEGVINSGYLLPMFIMTVFLAPICEELIFRKAIFELCNNKYIGLIISTFTFGFIHVMQGDYINLISYAASGLAFGLIYIKNDKNVAITIFVHSLSNLISLIAIAFI